LVGIGQALQRLPCDAAWRGQGVSTLLLKELMCQARARGARRIELDSAFHKEAAHRFYERQGFEKHACLFSKPL
jgi:GNAT superfamily N-acetyltransferase